MVDSYSIIKRMKEYADKNNVPIMMDDGIDFLTTYIIKKQVNKVLEIGTAIGYSSIMMCLCNPNVSVTTIERDEKRYLEALKNVKDLHLEDRITLIYNDALNVRLDDQFDLVFIDAAKAQNIKFFEMFERNLVKGGTIVTDNLSFHGMVNKEENEIKSRNVRALVRKIKEYISFLKKNKDFETEFYDIGDGISVSVKVK